MLLLGIYSFFAKFLGKKEEKKWKMLKWFFLSPFYFLSQNEGKEEKLMKNVKNKLSTSDLERSTRTLVKIHNTSQNKLLVKLLSSVLELSVLHPN